MANAWNAELYQGKHAFVWQHGASLLELLQPRPGETILDLGCGTGELTQQIADAGADVLGLDLSPAMLEQARRQHPGLTFVHGDARDFALAEPVDAIFSNAALHWIKEPAAVLACVAQALKPGGRFVAEFGGQGNVATIAKALLNVLSEFGVAVELPWYFPSIAAYTTLVENAGLETTYALLFDRPTPLQGSDGLRDWLAMFATQVLERIAPERHEEFLRRVEQEARPHLFRDGGWSADYRRLRIVARLR